MIKLKIDLKRYNEQVIFEETNFNIYDNDKIITIWGPSGSGKTTLFKILLGIDSKFEGELIYNDTNIYKEKNEVKYRNSIITCIFQDYKLLENLTVLDNLRIVNYKNISQSEIKEILKSVDLLEKKEEIVLNLSGGEKQRVAIARALMMDTHYILFDEPSTGLDDQNFLRLIEILNELKKVGKKIIIITHDARFKDIDTEQYEIKNKKIVPKKELNHEDIKIEKTDSKIKEYSSGFSLFKLTNTYKKNIIFNCIFIILSLIFLSFFLNIVIYGMNDRFNYLYGGIGDDTIVVHADLPNKESSDKIPGINILSGIDDRFAWSNEDVENVLSIEHVKSVKLATPESHFIGNKTKEGLYDPQSISTSEFDLGLSRANAPENIEFEFITFPVPKEFGSRYYPPPNQYKYGLIYGDYPADGSNEILIPDFLATKYTNEKIEEVVGTEIELPISNVKKNNEKLNKEYKVSGIYETNYKNKLENEYPIYLGYVEAPMLSSDKEFYNGYLENAKNELDEEGLNYYSNVLSSYENFSKAISTGHTTMLINVDNYSSEEQVLKELEKFYPNNMIKSQYYYRNGKYSYIYRKLIIMEIMIILIIIIMFTVINLILFRNYYNLRIKEISILKTLGYTNKKINIWILLELLLTFIIALIIFLLVSIFLKLYISGLVINWIILSLYIIINVTLIYLYIIFRTSRTKIIQNIK